MANGTKSRRNRVAVAVALALVAGCGGRSNGPPDGGPDGDKKAAPRPWQPEAKLLDQLDSPVEIAAYLIRPPKGYKSGVMKVAPIHMISWESPAAADRTYVMVSVVNLPDPDNPKHGAEKTLTAGVDALRSITSDWSRLGPPRVHLARLRNSRDQSSFRIVPMPRFLVNSELPLLSNRSR